ncbi:hypothetical protein K5I04_01615 [Murdochiella sp. Marseille-P8839]|nr:hypothetical protein [Murdochiella sp. Marseille-P8839]
MEDIKNVYTTFWEDLKVLSKAFPTLLLAALGYALAQKLLSPVTAAAGFLAGGFLAWLIEMAIKTHFATIMTALFAREKLMPKDLVQFDGNFFPPLTQAFFLLFVVEFFASRVLSPLLPAQLLLFIGLIWKVFTAPLFEVVYLAHEPSARLFSAMIEFWRDNWQPMFLYSAACIALTLLFYPAVFSTAVFTVYGAGAIALQAVLYAAYGLTKGILFRILYFSTPRSRAYHHQFDRKRR